MAELGKRRRARPKGDQLEKKRLSTALMKISDRALTVNRRDVEAYVPREIDIQIAEAMLAGAITFAAIAEVVGVSNQYVGDYMKDPLACAWISHHIHGHVAHRLGMIDAAMINRALAGDVAAANLCYKRFGEMVQRTQHVHLGASMDFSKLPVEDLEAMFVDAQKQNVIDVTPTRDDQRPDGGGGDKAPEA